MKNTVLEQVRHAQIWNLLEEYADIRDDLDDLLYSFQDLQESISLELENISGYLDDVRVQLDKTSSRLIRFKNAGSSKQDTPKEEGERLPWN